MFQHLVRYAVCGLALAGLMGMARTASAQSSDLTVGLGYDLVYHEVDSTSNAGFHLDVAKGQAPHSSWVGEFGINHFFKSTVSSYMGGARFPMGKASGGYKPFVQLLAGAYHCNACDSTDFALQPGLGVDVQPKKHNFKIRGQFDIRHVFVKNFEDYNGFRISGGIVLPIK
jgi:hypothetical protein